MSLYIIIMPIILLVICCIYGFGVNPLQIKRARVIQKEIVGLGNRWKITFEIDGEIVEMYAKYYVYNNVEEGEEITIWYRGNFCMRFSK